MTKSKKNSHLQTTFNHYFKDRKLQRIFIGVVTILLAFIIILSGTMPQKYKLSVGERSEYDITAQRDIDNTYKLVQDVMNNAQTDLPDVKEIRGASIEVFSQIDGFSSLIQKARKNYEEKKKNITSMNESGLDALLENEKQKAISNLNEGITELGIKLSEQQIFYLISLARDYEIENFETVMKELISSIMMKDITEEDLAYSIVELQNNIEDTGLNQELKNVGVIVLKKVLKPNTTISKDTSEIKGKITANSLRTMERYTKGQRIISKGDIITQDKYRMLEQLNLIRTKDGFDYPLALGVLFIVISLSLVLILYIKNFCRKILYNRSDMILLSIVILLTLLIARALCDQSSIAIPIFLATMLISILLQLKLAVFVNVILTIAISLMVNGEPKFFYLGLISGTFAAFAVSKANQRNQLTIAGVIVALLNVVVIGSINIISENSMKVVLDDSIIVFLNGLFSIVITIGLLPFLEAAFNIITPLRLLELANPNQPLLKRLLLEAPGTYHHSLMVGNLAEVGTENIGGNPLLARVGAYFHDVGKLKRPSFFMENQLGENPHDKMTSNLSTLVITSHVEDGIELAKKYKIPMVIRDIILQHHGTTLVAYFYHKAVKVEKLEVDEEKFRYTGEKPSSKEAAVVMIADSVEAAVRSMPDKTEGKIEGLIRKIIKDKLDDGQLDHCSLTLKDLDIIAKSFLKVFSGYFHGREEYPELKKEGLVSQSINEDGENNTNKINNINNINSSSKTNDIVQNSRKNSES